MLGVAPSWGFGLTHALSLCAGTATSNSKVNGHIRQDRSDYNRIVGNRLGPRVTAEMVDAKTFTCCGLIANNTLDGANVAGMTGADSWVNANGNDWRITGNIGHNPPTDGFQTHNLEHGEGYRNSFERNTCYMQSRRGRALLGGGYCVNSKKDARTRVGCDNRAINGKLTNVQCTSAARDAAVEPVDPATEVPAAIEVDPESVPVAGVPERDAPPPADWLDTLFGPEV